MPATSCLPASPEREGQQCSMQSVQRRTACGQRACRCMSPEAAIVCVRAPPMRFMAMAMVSCVSREMAPRDMPPVQKRLMMSAAGSTCNTTGLVMKMDL